MSIIVTGSLSYDRIMDFPGRFREHILPDKIHILNVSFTLNRFEEQFGGTAGNIAYNLKLLGFDPVIVAAAGRDFGRYAERLERIGIRTKHVAIFENEQTAMANMITDLDDNQISAFYPGALVYGRQVEIPKEFKNKENILIIAPSSKQEIAARCLEARSGRLPYIFDPGQQIVNLSAEEAIFGAQNSKVSIFNDYEWQVFSATSGLTLKDLTAQGVAVIVTQGHDGSIIHAPGAAYRIGVARPVQVEDPTGAGDAYRAGIIAGMVKGWDWETAGQVASTIASFAVERYGTQEHNPSLQDIRDRYQISFSGENPL